MFQNSKSAHRIDRLITLTHRFFHRLHLLQRHALLHARLHFRHALLHAVHLSIVLLHDLLELKIGGKVAQRRLDGIQTMIRVALQGVDRETNRLRIVRLVFTKKNTFRKIDG